MLTAPDAALLAQDLVTAIEAEAALTVDPSERAELDRQLDDALSVLERAHQTAETERRGAARRPRRRC